MGTFTAFLRGINVGGATMVPMPALRELFVSLGYLDVRTHIQSGNVIFRSSKAEKTLVREIERALLESMGKDIRVFVRAGTELAAIVERNPFKDAEKSKVGVLLLGSAPPADLVEGAKRPGGEELRLIGREIFVHYPGGMGRSRLKFERPLPDFTTRNVNTIEKLLALCEEKD